MNRYTSPCFSGECGLCNVCCDTDYNHISPEVSRARDTKLFYGRNRMDEISNEYNKNLNLWCKERGYRNPQDRGWVKSSAKRFRKGSFEPIVFHLLTESHPTKICSDPRCRLISEEANEWNRDKTYSIIPLYSWKDNVRACDKYICGVCFDTTSSL